MIEYIWLHGTKYSFWTAFKLGAISEVSVNSSHSIAVHYIMKKKKKERNYDLHTKRQDKPGYFNRKHYFLKGLYISAAYW